MRVWWGLVALFCMSYLPPPDPSTGKWKHKKTLKKKRLKLHEKSHQQTTFIVENRTVIMGIKFAHQNLATYLFCFKKCKRTWQASKFMHALIQQIDSIQKGCMHESMFVQKTNWFEIHTASKSCWSDCPGLLVEIDLLPCLHTIEVFCREFHRD